MITPSSPFRVFFAAAVASVLLVATGVSASNCAAEFDPCYTTRDCCGRHNLQKYKVECVMGAANQLQRTVCKSKRSQAFDQITLDLKLDKENLWFLLTHYFYHTPEVSERFKEKYQIGYSMDGTPEIEQYFMEMADMYKNDFARLIANIEDEYDIEDPLVLPKLLREFLSWRDQIDIKGVFEGKYDEAGEVPVNFSKKGHLHDEPEEELPPGMIKVL